VIGQWSGVGGQLKTGDEAIRDTWRSKYPPRSPEPGALRTVLEMLTLLAVTYGFCALVEAIHAAR